MPKYIAACYTPLDQTSSSAEGLRDLPFPERGGGGRPAPSPSLSQILSAQSAGKNPGKQVDAKNGPDGDFGHLLKKYIAIFCQPFSSSHFRQRRGKKRDHSPPPENRSPPERREGVRGNHPPRSHHPRASHLKPQTHRERGPNKKKQPIAWRNQ